MMNSRNPPLVAVLFAMLFGGWMGHLKNEEDAARNKDWDDGKRGRWLEDFRLRLSRGLASAC